VRRLRGRTVGAWEEGHLVPVHRSAAQLVADHGFVEADCPVHVDHGNLEGEDGIHHLGQLLLCRF
jgi:hypothetical protein